MAEQLELDLYMAPADAVLTAKILGLIFRERGRQDEKWGVQDHPVLPTYDMGEGNFSIDEGVRLGYESRAEDYKRYNAYVVSEGRTPAWDSILLEEVYEALAEAGKSDADYEEELVQIAAVVVCMVENNIRNRRARDV